jgi:hypothetical protein
MKASELIVKAGMQPVPKGRMSEIGWADGYLVIRYGKAAYVYGPAVAEAERDKLLRVPYPDNTLKQLSRKNGWKCFKIGGK